MLAVSEALDVVLSHTDPLPSVTANLSQASGKVLTHDVVALEPVPPFRASVKVGSRGFLLMCLHGNIGWVRGGIL